MRGRHSAPWRKALEIGAGKAPGKNPEAGQAERTIQREAVKTLRRLGHTCLVTSSRKKSKNTRGTPDVFVSMADGDWRGLEFKSETGKDSEAQFVLIAAGLVFRCRSVDDALFQCGHMVQTKKEK